MKKIKFVENGRLNDEEMNFVKGGASCDDRWEVCGERAKSTCFGGYHIKQNHESIL